MRDSSSGKKVLLTTVYTSGRGYYDYVESNTFGAPLRMTWVRRISYGLRFIKQNVPEVEILEYPTWKEYVRKLEEGWDVVGFSFYLNEVPEILEMVDVARRKGVSEIWGGNYGALTEAVQPYFDRVFVGYAEGEIARFFGRRVKKLVHPPLIGIVGTTFGIRFAPIGVLFTTRGCGVGCKFCQTPSFCSRPSEVPLESVGRVLEFYKEMGLGYVLILDENFGLLRKHAEDVVSLLHEHGFMWFPMVRADLLNERLEEWRRMGLKGALIGIESFDQSNLDEIGKREHVEMIKELIRRIRLSWKDRGTEIGGIGYYIIGYENETEESIKGSLRELKEFNPGFVQLCVLTPLPRTPLWRYLDEEYGIFEKDWHRFDCKHLVWNHPHVEPGRMEGLLRWGMKEINSGHLFRYIFTRFPEYVRGFKFYFRDVCLANLMDASKHYYFPSD